MFNVGGGELLVIMVIALIVLGPKRLPDAARQVGKAMGDLRKLSSGFQNEIKSALDTADDPNRVAARRNPLAKDEGAAPGPSGAAEAPARAEPLVAGPPMERKRPSAQARAAAKKPAPKKAAAKNGTPVKKTTKTAAKKSAKKSAKSR